MDSFRKILSSLCLLACLSCLSPPEIQHKDRHLIHYWLAVPFEKPEANLFLVTPAEIREITGRDWWFEVEYDGDIYVNKYTFHAYTDGGNRQAPEIQALVSHGTGHTKGWSHDHPGMDQGIWHLIDTWRKVDSLHNLMMR